MSAQDRGNLRREVFLERCMNGPAATMMKPASVSNMARPATSAPGEGSNPKPAMVQSNITTPLLSSGALPSRIAEKGIQARSVVQSPIDDQAGEVLLTAIAKARMRVDDLVQERVKVVAEIAEREDKSERYVRMLMTLAFVSPQMVDAVIEGRIHPPTVSMLAQKAPISWKTQILAS